MLRFHIRIAMFARRATGAVTLSDISYTTSGVALVAAALWLDQEGERVTSVLAALAVANVIAIGVALRALRLRIRVSLRTAVWRRYHRIWSDISWSLFGATTWTIQSQGIMFLVAAIAGPAAYAPIAAGYVLFNPVRQALIAFLNVFRADFVAALTEGRYRRLNVTVYSVCALILLSCAATGAAIWLTWPYLDAHILAGKFDHAAMPLVVTLCGHHGGDLSHL